MKVTYTSFATDHPSDPMELDDALSRVLTIPGWTPERVTYALEEGHPIYMPHGYYLKYKDQI